MAELVQGNGVSPAAISNKPRAHPWPATRSAFARLKKFFWTTSISAKRRRVGYKPSLLGTMRAPDELWRLLRPWRNQIRSGAPRQANRQNESQLPHQDDSA